MDSVWKSKPIIESMQTKLLAQATELRETYNIYPKLAIIRIGDKPEAIAYTARIEAACSKCNVSCENIVFEVNTPLNQVNQTILNINANKWIHGCILMRPCSSHRSELMFADTLAPEKDVDGMTPESLYNIMTDNYHGFPPCTPHACIEILKYHNVELEGKKVVIIGRSVVIGKPLAHMMLYRNATVTICHSKTQKLPEICKNADIIISATGHPHLITRDYVSEGQIVIDCGTFVDADGSLVGDVKFDEVADVVSGITPVPGGVGGITTMTLVKHVIESAQRSNYRV